MVQSEPKGVGECIMSYPSGVKTGRFYHVNQLITIAASAYCVPQTNASRHSAVRKTLFLRQGLQRFNMLIIVPASPFGST